MKASEVLKLLDISRVTLWSYVKNGKIKVTMKHNGYYDYDEESVYKLANITGRKNIIYGRVSTYKQKKDLDRQIILIKKYCEKKILPSIIFIQKYILVLIWNAQSFQNY